LKINSLCKKLIITSVYLRRTFFFSSCVSGIIVFHAGDRLLLISLNYLCSCFLWVSSCREILLLQNKNRIIDNEHHYCCD